MAEKEKKNTFKIPQFFYGTSGAKSEVYPRCKADECPQCYYHPGKEEKKAEKCPQCYYS